MKKTISILIVSLLFISCSSTRLLDQWKDPNTIDYKTNKVLVIGITKNEDARRLFENDLTSKLVSKGVNAVKSIDFFGESFTSSKKTEEDLNIIENKLIESDFDAILISKVINSEDKVTFVKAFRNFNDDFKNFKEDYYQNQDIYYSNEYYEETKIYHAETALYCICTGKERELLWRASIDITNPYKAESTIKDYVNLILKELKNQKLLIVQD